MLVAVILLLILLMLVAPLYVEIQLDINSHLRQLYIGFGFLQKRHIYKLKIPLEPKYIGLFSLSQVKKHIQKMKVMRTEHYGIINYAISDLTIEKLYIRAYIGLGDAGTTAILCGTFITAIELIYQYLKSNLKVEYIEKEICPIYDNRNYIDIDLDCIMWMRTGYIINIACRAIFNNMVKAVKNKWQTHIQ